MLLVGAAFTTTSIAAIPKQPAGSYECVAKAAASVAPPPAPSASVAALAQQQELAPPSTTPLCSGGKVPQSTALASTGVGLDASRTAAIEASKVKGVPPRAPGEAAPPSIGGEGGYYYYAEGFQTSIPAGTSGMSALQTQQSPTTDPNDTAAHSI